MLRQQVNRFAGGGWHGPATERNKGPILELIERLLPRSGLVLEPAAAPGRTCRTSPGRYRN